jgi:hypothetical protein
LARKDDLVNHVGQTKNDKESNNNGKDTISTIKMAWNNKQITIARASTWSMNLKMNKDCKANKDNRMVCDDECNG